MRILGLFERGTAFLLNIATSHDGGDVGCEETGEREVRRGGMRAEVGWDVRYKASVWESMGTKFSRGLSIEH